VTAATVVATIAISALMTVMTVMPIMPIAFVPAPAVLVSTVPTAMISVVPSGVLSIVAVPSGFARLGVACNGEQAYENDYRAQSHSDSFQHND
jgi:hypothetical protein